MGGAACKAAQYHSTRNSASTSNDVSNVTNSYNEFHLKSSKTLESEEVTIQTCESEIHDVRSRDINFIADEINTTNDYENNSLAVSSIDQCTTEIFVCYLKMLNNNKFNVFSSETSGNVTPTLNLIDDPNQIMFVDIAENMYKCYFCHSFFNTLEDFNCHSHDEYERC